MEITRTKLVVGVLVTLLVILLLVAYYEGWFSSSEKEESKPEKKSNGKEGFIDPETSMQAQQFMDEGDVDVVREIEESGYAGPRTAMERELMPERDEMGYDGDWSNWIAHEGAEPSVHLSHQQYIKELGPHTRGVSNLGIIDHDNDSNWRGVDRRPQYSNIPMHPGAREVHGEHHHQFTTTGITRHDCGKVSAYAR